MRKGARWRRRKKRTEKGTFSRRILEKTTNSINSGPPHDLYPKILIGSSLHLIWVLSGVKNVCDVNILFYNPVYYLVVAYY